MKWKPIILHGSLLAATIALLIYSGLQIYQRSRPDFETYNRLRHGIAKTNKGPIWIAVAWKTEDYNQSFYDGIRLAVEQINADGGLLGRPLLCRVFDGEEHAVAREIVADPRYLAVIGHETSDMAVPVSLTYEKGGILFIAPFATHPDLTVHRFELTLRSIPDDADMVRAMVAEIAAQGMTNAVVVNVRNRYGTSLAKLFEDIAYDHNIQISFIDSYTAEQGDFRRLAYHIKQHPFDCVVVADFLPRAAELIVQLREQHIKAPFFGADGLDSPQLWEIAGAAADNTYVASSYEMPVGDSHEQRLANAASDLDRRLLVAFGENRKPDNYAASGYEAVMLYRQAVEASKTAIPIVVSSTLKYEGPWQGLNGPLSFDEFGNVQSRSVAVKVVRNGRFVKLKKGSNHDSTRSTTDGR